MSNREYEARRDLLELHALLDSGMRPVDIAREMRKDPAWVSRSTRRLREDDALTIPRPEARELIDQTETRLNLLYQQAFRAAMNASGPTQIAGFRNAGALLRQLTDFRLRVGSMDRDRSKLFDLDNEGGVIRISRLHQLQRQEETALLANGGWQSLPETEGWETHPL